MRSAIKRTVMNAYCAGWLPAWCLVALFAVLRLGKA